MRILRVAVLGGLLVSGLNAQEPIRSRQLEVVVAANPQADALHERAVALYDQPHLYRMAARLHEEEARARSELDPRRVEALIQAARLLSYVPDANRARNLMERAAELMLQRGDVSRSAHALIDAAFLAIKIGDSQVLWLWPNELSC